MPGGTLATILLLGGEDETGKGFHGIFRGSIPVNIPLNQKRGVPPPLAGASAQQRVALFTGFVFPAFCLIMVYPYQVLTPV